MQTPAERLFALWGEIRDLETASLLLEWDLETYMPPKGQEARGHVLSTLAGARHAKLIAPELADAIAAASASAEPDSELAVQAAEARRKHERAARVPTELAKALAAAATQGFASWHRARSENDWSLFEADLEHIVDLRRQQAAAIDPAGSPYDVLIDDFEPGAKAGEIAPVFDELRKELVPLVRAVAASGHTVDESPVQGQLDPDAQLAFSRGIAEQMGFDFEGGRLDRAPHPFCQSFGTGDVRLTWRHLPDDLRSALFGIMHEAGHGLYEQGLPADWDRTPIGCAQSMTLHESQSRLWENLVGRSRPFWNWALPALHAHFPAKRDVTVDALWPALHTVRPSLIRVEADEATYNLHIIVRFEIERRLFAGDIAVRDLPAVWDNTYEELLGVRSPDAANGVLQDIHWSGGMFGYFPTYALGNLVAAQLFEAAERNLGSQDDAFARGDFGPLLNWLREHVHRHANRHSVSDIVERATGKPLTAAPFLTYIKGIAAEVYNARV